MTLTNELDLDILPLDLTAKIQDRKSVHSARRVRRTDGRTHTHTDGKTDNAKSITSITSDTWDVINFSHGMPVVCSP